MPSSAMIVARQSKESDGAHLVLEAIDQRSRADHSHTLETSSLWSLDDRVEF